LKISESIIIFALFCFTTSCTEQVEVCDRISSWKILSESETGLTCIYQQVYLYQEAYYTVCNCCLCDKLPMAIDCDGEPLCEFTDDCMEDFFRKAEYIFSAVEDQ